MVTLPDQPTLDAWLAQARQTVADAETLIDVDSVEARIYSTTNQVDVIIRNATKPGMADGTAGTPDAPENATDADANANSKLGERLTTGLRDLGASVENRGSDEQVVVVATFSPDQ
jgi:hypothetical protein